MPRTRFTPLRTTEHLFALASDAYEATLDYIRVGVRANPSPNPNPNPNPNPIPIPIPNP